MKTSFRPRLLNGQTGDPALLVSLRWQGRALLIDLGRIDRTPAATLLRVEAVFVSHAHMDHFMGFDQLLRLFLARDATLRLYGPAGIADHVAGKLAGYTWNLTDDYPFTLEVTELAASGLRPGPWLNVLKAAVRAGQPEDTPIEVAPGDRRPLGALRDALLVVTPGQKIAYVVDALFSPANARRIVQLAAGADLFFCEAPFLEEDIEQATRRYHLTAGQAGALARAAGVKRLHVFHFSPRYEGRYGAIVAEAEAEFTGLRVRYAELDARSAAVS